MSSNAQKGRTLERSSHFFHTEKSRCMRASVLCRIRKDRVNQTGNASVYLQIIVNSEKLQIPLRVSWPVQFFDSHSGIFLERYKGDTQAHDFNMLAQLQMAKANEIFIYYRHNDQDLTAETFRKEFSRFGARTNFLQWAELEIEDRFQANRIQLQTRKNSLASINKIRQWRDVIKFSELDTELLKDLQAWLKNSQGMKINSVGGILKTIKVYARAAHEQGLAINLDSISKFKLPQAKGRITYLKPEELIKLHHYYLSEEISPSHKRVLGQFLFSTMTGLRFSDIERVEWKHIDDDSLDFEPYKTRSIEKRVKIPLTESAFSLIQSKKGKLFDTVALQATNRVLKEISLKCSVRKNITTHVARHTFATEFLRKGGAIEVLKELMGHTKIETTMIYTHVDEARKREQMKMMEYEIFSR